MSKEMIKLDNIDVTFHQKKRTIEAVKDVTIHINQGDIYGIVGYSGAGKSTLVRVINLLQVPTAGKITIDEDVIFEGDKVTLTPAQLRIKRREIGMIFQHFNLMAQMTAAENVAFALKHSGLTKEEKAAKVAKLLDLVGLADRAENYPSQLSGGQKQRVAIARALANDPKILISDESTSALDPKTTKQILALLQELNEKLGLTIVMITHEMQIVKDICNRVAVMQDGQLIEEGSVLEIFSHPKQELTQDFIKTATGIDEALVKIYQQGIVQNLPEDSLLVQLKYSGASTDTAIANDLYKMYQVTSNILYGNIEILDHTPVGELVVILSGEPAQLHHALEAVAEAQVEVTVLKGAQDESVD
ncbi:TPA: methionine ABC transporter ATP-binding protein [Streptococcus suis]